MPHDSIQILLVVKPSQKDREFGNCGDNHCSKRRSMYIQDVPEKFFHPSYTVSINSAIDKNN